MNARKVVDNKMVTKYKAVAPKRCGKKRKTNTPFLPAEMIFHILMRLPADILYNTMRYVCKQWFDVVKNPRFIREQMLACSTGGIFFQSYEEYSCYFALFGNRKGTMSKLFTLPSRLLVLATCDGLILVRNKTTGTTYVANPLTKQLLTLPPTTPYPGVSRYPGIGSYSLGCARSTMEYKVVFVGFCNETSPQCRVITIGKDDAWRSIYIPLLYPSYNNILFRQPVSVGNFVYWTDHEQLVTFDMEYENLYPSYFPVSEQGNYDCRDLIVKGGSLTCLIGFCNTTMWEVWVLLDNIGRKWKKLYVIDFRNKKRRLKRIAKHLFDERFLHTAELTAVAWVNNGDVLVFRSFGSPVGSPCPFIAYNIQTGNIFQLPWPVGCYNPSSFYPFAPSLISPN